MKYYKLMFNDENAKRNDVICEVEDGFEEKYGISKNELHCGIQIDNWDSNITFFYSKENGFEMTDFVANDLGWYIVSPRVQSIFNDLNITDVQLLPVAIKENDSTEIIRDYKVINITNMIEAFDEKKSDYKEFKAKGKSMLSIKKYSLLAGKIINYNWFKIPENRFSSFVSEFVVNEFKEKNISGIDYIEVSVS